MGEKWARYRGDIGEMLGLEARVKTTTALKLASGKVGRSASAAWYASKLSRWRPWSLYAIPRL